MSTRAAKRAEYILQELSLHGRIDAEQLSQQLQVNSSTIRRDLERLEQRHLLRRVHGGALPIDAPAYSSYAYDLTFQENMRRQSEEKAQIARLALSMIEPGDTIALSPGTTTTHLAHAIRQAQLQPLTIVTNALNIAMELNGLKNVTLTMIGGLLLPDFFALVGPLAEQSLKQIYTSKAFIGVTGLSPEHGLTGPNQLEALTHRLTIEHAQRAIVLADHTKLGKVALHAIAPPGAVQVLITDRKAPPEMLAKFGELGLRICQPPEAGLCS
ncbi:MAG TPA: DeoR/GlpR family DNA-binding transcription regulator [Ktedonobacteraceae bacterium]|jgi:DeoR/GlpR family transcriptional regulator of sugar metabolism|nr:DeoR/GlpR family DNA-binding transcription regulator [Ktedonobacteraceae bacterium]